MKSQPIKRIYLSGPMSGLPEHNFPAFNAEAARLRGLGYDVVNPVEINGDAAVAQGKSHIECVRADVAQLATCDTIALLPDCWQSLGVKIERAVGELLQLREIMASMIQKPCEVPVDPPVEMTDAYVRRAVQAMNHNNKPDGEGPRVIMGPESLARFVQGIGNSITVNIEHDNAMVVSHSAAKIKRVEYQDDGSITVFIEGQMENGVHIPVPQSHWPKVRGIGRDAGHSRTLHLYLDDAPDDNEMRAIHDALRNGGCMPSHPTDSMAPGMARFVARTGARLIDDTPRTCKHSNRSDCALFNSSSEEQFPLQPSPCMFDGTQCRCVFGQCAKGKGKAA